MTIIDRIFQEVAGISIPHFFITVEFSAMGCEMPERIEAFLWEKYEIFFEAQTVVSSFITKENGG